MKRLLDVIAAVLRFSLMAYFRLKVRLTTDRSELAGMVAAIMKFEPIVPKHAARMHAIVRRRFAQLEGRKS